MRLKLYSRLTNISKGNLTIIFLCVVYTFPIHSQTEGPKTIKVMSYNIHYGVGMDDKFDLARIAGVITAQNPDIVGLQEIGDSAMAAELGQLTGMNFFFGPSLEKMDGYGDAVLSKHPMKWVNNYSIPSASSSRYQAMGIDVDLSSIYGENTSVLFINTHFDWLKSIGSQEARLATVEVIERGFFNDKNNQAAILVGDLNAVPDSAPLLRLAHYGWVLENLGKELNTIRSTDPTRQIDYVLVRPKNQWQVMDVKVLDEPMASDHLPIVMTLKPLN